MGATLSAEMEKEANEEREKKIAALTQKEIEAERLEAEQNEGGYSEPSKVMIAEQMEELYQFYSNPDLHMTPDNAKANLLRDLIKYKEKYQCTQIQFDYRFKAILNVVERLTVLEKREREKKEVITGSLELI